MLTTSFAGRLPGTRSTSAGCATVAPSLNQSASPCVKKSRSPAARRFCGELTALLTRVAVLAATQSSVAPTVKNTRWPTAVRLAGVEVKAVVFTFTATPCTTRNR